MVMAGTIAAAQVDVSKLSGAMLRKTAESVVERVQASSGVLSADADTTVPVFEAREILPGRVVGRGGFCVVHEIAAFRLEDSHGSGSHQVNLSKRAWKRPSERSDRSFAATEDATSTDSKHMEKETFVHHAKRKQHRYVMKQLSEELIANYNNNQNDKMNYLKGVIDLAMEAKFLASLSHPNIMELRAKSAKGPFASGYFLVLDRMEESFPKRLKTWMLKERQCKGITGVITGSKKKVTKLLRERLSTARDVASAAGYLHEKGIIYRDLKPDNIGFDACGVLKLFDFGLAKELKEDQRTSNGLYLMTGFTGAIRYMAPEVGLRQPYNHKADVYSWGVLMWYIMALEPPYGSFTPRMFKDRVFTKGCRPAIFEQWPQNVGSLMRRSWDGNIANRPEFAEIQATLEKELKPLSGEAGRARRSRKE